jgi:WD40 repeat protein
MFQTISQRLGWVLVVALLLFLGGPSLRSCVTGGLGMLAARSGNPVAPCALTQVEQSPDADTKGEDSTANLDAFGDTLPKGAVARLGTLRWRARGEVETLAYAPDGKTVAALSNRGLCLFEAATGKLKAHINPPSTSFHRFAYSPDGARLACAARVANQKDVVQIWEATGHRMLKEIAVGQVYWLGWSADGQLLGATREEGAILLNEVSTGQVRRLKAKKLPPAVQGIPPCMYAPVAKLFAARDEASTIHVWDTTTGEDRYSLQLSLGKEAYIRELALSLDGRMLASLHYENAGKRNVVQLWNVASGKVTHTLGKDQEYLANVAFSPDGKTLATIGWNDVRFWDTASGRERCRAKGVANFGVQVAFAPDSRTLATAERHSGAIHLWDVDTGRLKPEAAGHSTGPYHVSFSPDGRRVASGGELDGSIIVWDPTTGKQLVRISRSPTWCRACAFSPDGKMLYSSWTSDKLVVFEAASGREWSSWTLEDPDRPDTRQSGMYTSLSADGKTLVALSNYRSKKPGGPFIAELLATGWDTATGKQLFRRRHDPVDFGIAVTPDSRVVAAIHSSDGLQEPSPEGGMTPGKGPIRLEELATGKRLLTLPGLEGQSQPLAFSPDGRYLTTNTFGPPPPGLDGAPNEKQVQALRVWETVSATELFVLRTVINSRVAFSHDGRVFAFSGPAQDVRLWGLRQGKEVRRLTGFTSNITTLAFSPDGTRLVTGLEDSTLLIWDVADVVAARTAAGLTDAEAARAWTDLGADARKAFVARAALADSPDKALMLLKKHLAPAAPPDAQRVQQLLAALDSEVFKVRETAQQEISAMGDLAAPHLEQALKGELSPEARRRIQALRDKLQGPVTQSEALRALRAVAVLEEITTQEAKQLLEKLASGVPDARLTREAKAALQRLERR